MKITHIIESSGGSADFVLYLLKYLPQYSHCIIYSDRTFHGRFDQVRKSFPNTSFLYWKHSQREISLIKDIKAAIALYRLLKNSVSDVLHLHSSKAGFLGRLVCFLQGKKNVIYTPNGLSFARKDVSALKVTSYVFLERVANWMTGKIICCSESEARELMAKGIKCSYINNGTEIFNYGEAVPKQPHALTIVTSGRVTIQKNPTLFNEIAKYFRGDPGYKFVWIGGGELEHVITSENVEITGWMERSGVTNRLAQADIYISTASWEGLPFAVLEAMNLSKPLLLTNCVGNVDLVKDNYNGFSYSTAEEAIAKIIYFKNNRMTTESFGNNSRKMAIEKFNVEHMAQQYAVAYNSFIKSTA